MIEAPSLESIIDVLHKRLSITTIKAEVRESDIRLGWMLTMERGLSLHTNEFEEADYRPKSRLVGILFCHPKSPIGEKELIPHLDYFHQRSGNFVDFFYAGYGASWPEDHCIEHDPVVTIDGTGWLFSAKSYNSIRKELESKTRWEYSGESDLLLFTARGSVSKDSVLDFTTAIACNLEQMQKDNAFSSIRSFFENIFRFGESYTVEDPVWDLSDREGLNQAKSFIKNYVLSLVPETLRDSYLSAKHYAVRDISK